jgi:hypothetical protein
MRTKIVKLCGKEVVMTLRDCRRCDEPTWFSADAFVCDECVGEFIELRSPERSSVKRSDRQYQGNIPDKTEAMGQPDEGR